MRYVTNCSLFRFLQQRSHDNLLLGQQNNHNCIRSDSVSKKIHKGSLAIWRTFYFNEIVQGTKRKNQRMFGRVGSTQISGKRAVQPEHTSDWTDSCITGSDCVEQASADSSVSPEGSAPIHCGRPESWASPVPLMPRLLVMVSSVALAPVAVSRIPPAMVALPRLPLLSRSGSMRLFGTCSRHKRSILRSAWPRTAHHGSLNHSRTFSRPWRLPTD